MPYIDQEFYVGYTGDNALNKDEFGILEHLAEDVIDSLTMNSIRAVGFESLPPFVQEQVQKATAIQVQTLAANGGSEALIASGTPDVRIGSFSYSGNNTQGVVSFPVAPFAVAVLEHTGLLNRGCGVNG